MPCGTTRQLVHMQPAEEGMAQPPYLLSCQSHHVKGPVHESPHQDLGAIFSSNDVVGPVVSSDVLEGQKPAQPLQAGLDLAFLLHISRTGWNHAFL